MKIYRDDFSIFKRKINGKRLAYLDSAATSQIAKPVLSAIVDYEENHRANVHRGVHALSEESTMMYEKSRENVAKFISAVVPSEIVFTRNSTESLNIVVQSWARNNLHSGDIILVSEIEHHSNFVPWQILAKENGLDIVIIPINSEGEIDIQSVKVDWSRVKVVAYHLVSNVFGVKNDAREINKYIKRRVIEAKKLSNDESNIRSNFPRIVIDVAQAIAHMEINVQKLGADFVVFSGHKMYGPMGIGVLWISRSLFPEISPYFTGGGMIKEVYFENTTFTDMPEKLEAGTPNVSGAIGLSAACDYISSIGYEEIELHETEIMNYMLNSLLMDEDIEIYGTKVGSKRCSVLAFNVKGIPSHDLASVLDSEGVAIRSGQHCVMPWHVNSGVYSTSRASLAIYSTKEDVDQLIEGIVKAKKILNLV